MPDAPPIRPPDLRALRSDLHDADDQKIRRIVALLDTAPELPVPETILATLRGRLTTLRPARPLRFARLLFVPLNELIVPPLGWQPGEPAIPRSILVAIAAAVRTALGEAEAVAIDRMIAGHDTHATQVITEAGALLWPRAGNLLADLPMPPDWSRQTGLRAGTYLPFARAIATVLRRAVHLHQVAQDAALGALEPSVDTVREIVRGLAGEPVEGCAMVVRLLLGCLPDPTLLARVLTAGSTSHTEQAMLKNAIERGVDGFLARMDNGSDLVNRLRHGPVSAVSNEVRRIARLLTEIEEQPDARRHRARLKSIRETLDGICRTRFGDELRDRLLAPLSTAAAVEGPAQRELEDCARHLRTLESAGRKIGSRAEYDKLLKQAGTVLQDAARSGRLTPGRQLRLLEILSGPDAAEAALRQYELRGLVGM